MTWDKITVEQFQAIHNLQQSKMDEYDRLTEIMALLHETTVNDIEELTVSEFNRMAKGALFLSERPPYDPKKVIKANGRKYAIIYNMNFIKQRQFVEITHFQSDIIGNLHNIMASIVQPVKWGIRRKNNPEQHSDYATDLLKARFVDVHSSALFFCKLYAASLRVTKDYLMGQVPQDQREEVRKRLSDLADIMDGFTQQKR